MLFAFLLTFGAVLAQSSVYKIKVKDADDREVSLKQYKGDVLLIVNTATQCGFTPQYKELETLYTRYKDRGFVILDFPCNQFGEQAPGSQEEIHTFCTSNYDIHFPQFAKIDVNGENASPLFVYLKKQQGFNGFGTTATAQRMHQMMLKRDKDYADKSDIKWNFTKFLVNRKGDIVRRFEPTTPMSEVESAIQGCLGK
uniref:Glutathione peroxidase n=2 Tax=unclassified Prevotella TaxID=2638335 RepID=A0AB33JMP3_9BACT